MSNGLSITDSSEQIELICPASFLSEAELSIFTLPLLSHDSTKMHKNSEGIDAIRIEFFGDTIESIRQINFDTQRSNEQIDKIKIVSAICGAESEQKEIFLKYSSQRYDNSFRRAE